MIGRILPNNCMNLVSYVKEFGEKTFSVEPFNDIDALILSQMSYINYNLLIPDMGFVKFKDILLFDSRDIYIDSADYFNNRTMLKLMMKCARYKNVKVGYFRQSFSKKTNKQFVAVTYILPNHTGFIAYRGTDMSLVGWKEDLYIAYRDHVPAAKDALNYLNDAVTLFKGDFYVGGHSKGGNLSVYATLHMPKKLNDRLVKVYSFDGPGFRTKIQECKNYPFIKDKIQKYLTSNDMIGVIYNNNENAKIVFSSGVLLGGHDPYRWQIDKNKVDFVYTKDRSYASKQYEEALMGWLTSMSDEDKELAVHIIFEMMGESKTVYDLLLNAGRLVISGRRRWENYTPQQRTQAREIFKKLGKYFLSAYSPKRFLGQKLIKKKADEEN